MRVRFLGGADGHVTGSCTHFSYDRRNIQFLVDCGMVQGEGNDDVENSKPFPFFPSEISFVLLTHAHQDHCGLIPKLYREGFSGKVICTRATARLTRIALMDSIRHVKCLFAERDVERVQFDCIDDREGFSLSRKLPIYDDLFASFTRSAHILGATSIRVWWINDSNDFSSVVMSSDLGSNTKDNLFQPLLAGRQGIIGYPDAIVVESTYGGHVRDTKLSDFDSRMVALELIIREEVFEKKSLLVIPAFSLQRTQELLFDLHHIFSTKFLASESSQAPCFALNPWYDQFENNTWSDSLQRALENAIKTLSDGDQEKWNNSIVKKTEKNRGRYSLIDGASISVSDIKRLITSVYQTYPVDIVLDSPLARKISSVFRDELCRRKRKWPTETLYRNRSLVSRLGLSDEEEVDAVVRLLLPSSDIDDLRISFGIHTIRHANEVSTPRPDDLQGRGCILITGGGMCNGGPVVEHLTRTLAAKRPLTILVTGYMAKGSLGHALVAIGRAHDQGTQLPDEMLTIGEKLVSPEDVTSKVIQLQGYYSGHADQEGLLDFVFRLVASDAGTELRRPATVFLNHGQHAARKALKDAIDARKATPQEGDRPVSNVELPDHRGHWYDLNLKEWVQPELQSQSDRLLQELLTEQRKTNQLLRQLLDQRHMLYGSGPAKRTRPGGK